MAPGSARYTRSARSFSAGTRWRPASILSLVCSKRRRATCLSAESIAGTVKRLLETENEACMTLAVHYGLAGTRRVIGQLVSGQTLLDSETFERRNPDEFASAWIEHLNSDFVPKLLRDFGDSEVVSEVVDLLRQNETSNPVMAERRRAAARAIGIASNVPRIAACAADHHS